MNLHGLITGYLIVAGWTRRNDGWVLSKRHKTPHSLMSAVEVQMRKERQDALTRLAAAVGGEA